MEVCRKFLELKKEIFKNTNSDNISKLRTMILKMLDDMNTLLHDNIFLLNSLEVFIFKPIILLKLWDSSTEENDISTYSDLNKLFYIKTLMKNKILKSYIKAFEEIKIVFEYENIFDRNQIFLYYFGKIVSSFVENIDKIKDETILSMLDKNKFDNFVKIKNILKGFGYPNSYNYKKKAKNYANLAEISHHFGVDPAK